MTNEHRRGCKRVKLEYASRMRRRRTPAEAVLWGHLRNKKLDGFRFRSQAIFFGFIVDFYCPSAKLIVEVDGSYHDGREGYDAMRDKRISSAGYRIIRFRNEEVFDNCEAVLAEIRARLQDSVSIKTPT